MTPEQWLIAYAGGFVVSAYRLIDDPALFAQLTHLTRLELNVSYSAAQLITAFVALVLWPFYLAWLLFFILCNK